MSWMIRGSLGCVALIAVAAGCASTPRPPFDQVEAASVVAYRLQNWEAPPMAAGAAAPAGALTPPLQIQQWIQQGAQGLQQLIPPGLLPPGLLPNVGTATAPAPVLAPQQTEPRFPQDSTPNFRILSQTQVMDPELKERLADILGNEDNFQAQHGGCMYAEVGVSFLVPPAPANNVLISFSCKQVQARNFAWPHAYTGIQNIEELAQVIGDIFPMGT
ncbi:hypothetical protein ACFL5O_05115 [Myxococcota bacterium]